jgi:hypothetical protein
MDKYKGLKVGFIGCGNIAHFHAEVLLHLGLNIPFVSYKNNRVRAETFANKYHIKKISSDWQSMLSEEKVDYLWVVASWDEIDNLLFQVLEYGIPTFFEKPIALTSSKIKEAIVNFPKMMNKVQVGYNRRFYPFMNQLKEDLRKEKVISIEMHIPETLTGKNLKVKQNILLQNSSHLFDLLYYLLGENYTPVNIFDLESTSHLGYTGLLQSESGVPVILSAIWDAPANFRLKFCTQQNRIYDLCPIEVLNVYEGIEKVEPSEIFPLRQYNPKKVAQYFALSDKGFKPGFLEQTEYFLNQTYFDNSELKASTLNSVFIITRLIENIKEFNAG